MDRCKIIIYSKKKIFIELLYSHIRECFKDINNVEGIGGENLIGDIEVITSMDVINFRLYQSNSNIILLDCCQQEEIDYLEKIINENKDTLNSKTNKVFIILLNNIYCSSICEKLVQKYPYIYLSNDIESLKNIIEKLIQTNEIEKSLSSNLTKREKEILILIAKGRLNKEIANELNIAERTVKNHIANLFKKINVYDRTQAAVYAIKNGIYNVYTQDL